MVTFWPWKGDDSSPASFEKALSGLSAKISKKTGKLDSLRQRSRRLIVLWTLYAGFAYLLYTILLVLVVGWKDWGAVEYAAVAGGPVIIYLVRLGLSSYYNYRTSSVQSHLDELQKQRDSTIEKLKAATKYNSTQELLKKYGGTPTPKPKAAEGSDRKGTPKQNGPKGPDGPRTSFVPPPTANIPGRTGVSPSQTSHQRSATWGASPARQQAPPTPGSEPQSLQQRLPYDTSAEFAPNAFAAAPQYSQGSDGSRWYDRLMDVLLGEDETRSGARLALICAQCRLVNGQAPPGIKHLEDLGRWRCGGCGAMNGDETEAKKIVKSIKEESQKKGDAARGRRGEIQDTAEEEPEETSPAPVHEDPSTDVTQYSSEEENKEMKEVKDRTAKSATEPEAPRRRSTRPTKGKKNTS